MIKLSLSCPQLTSSPTWSISFTWKGKVAVNHRQEVDRQLSEIRKAPLKPYQRMEILRFYLIPKLTHSLTLGQVHWNTLKRLDTMIRQAVRAWLRLSNNTPTSYFHTSVLKGGIGVPCLSSTVPFLKRSSLWKVAGQPGSSTAQCCHWFLLWSHPEEYEHSSSRSRYYC